MSDDPWGAILGSSAKPAAAPAPSAPMPAPAAQPGADPWHGVLGAGATPQAAPPAPVTAGAPQPGDFWTRWAGLKPASELDPDWKPTGNAFLDFMGRPLAKTESAGQTLKDLGLSALDYGTLGYGVPASWSKDVEQAHANIGILNYPTAAATYMIGPGKVLGPLARGSVLAEGALAGGASTISHGADGGWNTNPLDVAKGAGEGALFGKIGQTVGKYGGALVRGVASKLGFGGDPAAVTSAAEQAKTDAYSVYDNVHYSPTDISQGVDSVKSSIYPPGHDPTLPMNSPQTVNLLDKFFGETNKAAQATNSAQALSTVTGSSLNDIIKKFGDIARKNPTNFEGVAAAQARDGLTDLFHTAAPIAAPPGFDAATAETAAKLAHSQFKNAEALEGWQREINKYGGNVGEPVKAYNEEWYGNNTPQDDALMRIYQSQQRSGAVPRWATSILHEGMGAGFGELGGYAAGLPHGLGAGMGILGTYAVGKPLLKAGRALSQGIDTQQAFDEAYPALSGRSLTPIDTSAWQDALRRLGISAAISR